MARNIVIVTALILILTGCGKGGTWSGSSSGAAYNNPAGSGSTVTLSWYEPDTDADGNGLTDLAGYKVYYGKGSGNYTEAVDVGKNTEVSISGLSEGTWCFAATAYDLSGNESDFSGEACKEIKM